LTPGFVQRSDDPAISISRHASESGEPGSAKQPQQDRFSLIICRMAEHDTVRSTLFGNLRKRLIAKVTSHGL
jgi:hypothetical protein